MAWITKKPTGGFLVRWRDDIRRTRSKYARTRAEAEALKERRGRAGRTGRARRAWHPGMGRHAPTLLPAEDPRYSTESYLRSVINRDRTLLDSTREVYQRFLRVHIEGTALGRADVRTIGPEGVRDYWADLKIGPGAARHVKQLLSKAFNAAVREGLIDASPLPQAGIRVVAKHARQTEVVPLTVDEIERLASATRSLRDRVAVLLMASGGLAGEVGGLRVQDVDSKRCRLNLWQQVVQMRSARAFTPLKTRAAKRTVVVPTSVMSDPSVLARRPGASRQHGTPPRGAPERVVL